MKNQNDLIFSIVSLVFGLVLFTIFIATQPSVTKPADPTPVDLTTPKAPEGAVQFATSLPGASNSGASGGFSGMGPGMGMTRGPGAMGPASMGRSARGGGRIPGMKAGG
jgi:hypothetical protein